MNNRLASTCLIAVLSLFTTAECRAQESAPAEKPDANSMIGKKAGEIRTDNGLKMKLVWCPPGFVTMEQRERVEESAPANEDTSDDEFVEKPIVEPVSKSRKYVFKITPVKALVTRGYWLGVYEVTQSEWLQVMPTGNWKGRSATKIGDNVPATFVTWDDATAFCQKLTEREREAGRLPADWEYTLPTEAEWERACRAQTETKYSFGDDDSKLHEYAWFRPNVRRGHEPFAHEVGQKKPNPWGLYDIHGNVWEWCRDWWSEKLPGGRDPEVTKPGRFHARVLRGGSWLDLAEECGTTARSGFDWPHRDSKIGFRVALSSPGKRAVRPTPAAPESK